MRIKQLGLLLGVSALLLAGCGSNDSQQSTASSSSKTSESTAQSSEATKKPSTKPKTKIDDLMVPGEIANIDEFGQVELVAISDSEDKQVTKEIAPDLVATILSARLLKVNSFDKNTDENMLDIHKKLFDVSNEGDYFMSVMYKIENNSDNPLGGITFDKIVRDDGEQFSHDLDLVNSSTTLEAHAKMSKAYVLFPATKDTKSFTLHMNSVYTDNESLTGIDTSEIEYKF